VTNANILEAFDRAPTIGRRGYGGSDGSPTSTSAADNLRVSRANYPIPVAVDISKCRPYRMPLVRRGAAKPSTIAAEFLIHA